MHQSNWGEKENLGDDFSLTKGSNCLKRLMIWTGSDLIYLMLGYRETGIWSTAIF
jgi:hypothetical protein